MCGENGSACILNFVLIQNRNGKNYAKRALEKQWKHENGSKKKKKSEKLIECKYL